MSIEKRELSSFDFASLCKMRNYIPACLASPFASLLPAPCLYVIVTQNLYDVATFTLSTR